tara:strand:+ start:2656 stop:3090 length:435 start_codon:yes stop_codon:yes gene_type:complete
MSFNVVISSNKKVSGTNADATYNFQFQQFQQGDYEVSFAYQSSLDTKTLTNNIQQIQLPDLPQLNYRADTKIGTASSGVIGLCYAEIVDGKERYVSRWGDNPPIFCKGLPSSGTFRVKLGEETDGSSTIDIPDDYVLILSFKKL